MAEKVLAATLDEPLSNLDARLREEVRKEIKALAKQFGLTVLYVTHDQDEAMDLADRIAVMHLGKILQLGSPEDLYNNPADPRVAQFFGEMNWIPGEMAESGLVITSFGALDTAVDSSLHLGDKVWVGVRPEHVLLQAGDTATSSDGQHFLGEIVTGTFLGNRRAYTVKVGDVHLSANGDPDTTLTGAVTVHIPSNRSKGFAATSADAGLSPVTTAAGVS